MKTENAIGALTSDFPPRHNRRPTAVRSGMVDYRRRAPRRESNRGARFTSEEEGDDAWKSLARDRCPGPRVRESFPAARPPARRRTATVISPEPALAMAAGAVAEKTIETAPVKTVSFADRHPLFSKPRQYWETSGDNKIVKAAAATFIGVPAGFVGEVKQIFVGAPPETRYLIGSVASPRATPSTAHGPG